MIKKEQIGHTGAMKSTDEFFAIEKKKHFDFYLPFYQEKNWLVEKDNIEHGSPISWDVRLEVFAGEFKKVDEKVRVGEFNDCLIEIMQDIKTGNLGWIFGDKDWVLYGSWKDLDEIYPSSLYLISMPRLRNHIWSLKGVMQTAISHKGWGITWNITRTWEQLDGIAKRLL